jgi:glycosyltransferase involved in cell wall biosynthesis
VAIDVSVVIPTFRRPELLGQTLGSVLRQRGVTLEVLVVDDSPEGSAEAVVTACGDPRVSYLQTPAPSGGFPSAVRNFGWPMARGAVMHFLDDDDLVPDGHYAAVLPAFAEAGEIGVVFGRVEPFGEASASQMRHEHGFFRDAARRAAACRRFGRKLGFTAGMMFSSTLFVCGAALIRGDCVRRLGGFDGQIRLGEDIDFFGRAMRQFGARFIDRVALRYRIGSPSLMHAPVLSEREIQQLRDGIQRMHRKYRAERGLGEFYAMKGFSRLVLAPCTAMLR